MQITVTIPDELAAQVQTRGEAIETYAEEAMREKLARQRAKVADRKAAVESMQRFAEEYGFTLSTGDLKSTLHEGHNH